MSEHMWDAKHDYYCSETNYFSSDAPLAYKSWGDFMAEEGDADMDYNLIFRWDWSEGDSDEGAAFTGDDNYRNGTLRLFYIGQRKGLFRSVSIEVCRADEEQVRSWLLPRMKHLFALWSPLTGEAS